MFSENFAAIASMVNLVGTVFGGFVFLMAMKSRQDVQDVLLSSVSKQVERLEKTVEELRRGHGWIKGPFHHEDESER